MTELPRIGVLVGSLQAKGLTHKVAKGLRNLLGDKLVLEILSIGDLPLYNPELEEIGVPAWNAFRASTAPLAGILFVTPEYNRSVPAALKNAIDVGSRPYGASVWSKKPAGIISQSPGALGGFGATHHLRQSLVFLDMPTMQQPEAYLGHSAALFAEDDTLLDGSAKTFLETFAAAFVAWVTLHTPARA